MTVYIENVVIDNFVMTYLIADLSYKIGGVRASRLRSALASFIATIVAIFYPFIHNNFALFAVKFMLYAMLSLILYFKKNKKSLPFIFLAVTAGMGGGVFFIAFLLCGDVRRALYGAYDISPGLIILAGWALYRTVKVVKIKVERKRNIKNFLRKVKITIGTSSVCVEGLIDSGNAVFDEKSTLPVMFLSASDANRLLLGKKPEDSGSFCGYTSVNDISGRQVRLPLVRPDKVEIDTQTGPEYFNDALIAVSDALGLRSKNYAAILHPAMIKGG